MMSGYSKQLVNKQFNSPIGLYTENNIKEILERESKILANGIVGIDFHNPLIAKPANLHNSAVLRMLEEEESRQRSGKYTGIKRVAWPPPRDGEDSEDSKTDSQYQQEETYRQPTPPVKLFKPPPSIITLRPKVPVSQAPAPVLTSQPATATLKGGKNLRGDLKWPPEDVKDRMEAENRQRMELARGPACRPRKIQKDYSSFFAQHALNNSYPGYKIPPGTQYYDHHPVM